MTVKNRVAFTETVDCRVRKLYEDAAPRLPFHGWHHISFVREKAVEFSHLNGADSFLVELAALLHDINYITPGQSGAAEGRLLRKEILTAAGADSLIIEEVELIIIQAETSSRGAAASLEVQALSDADTLFKALPITPVIFAPKYLAERKISIRELAEKIVAEQNPLLDEGIYFYNENLADRYLPWARANLSLWRCIRESPDDPDVVFLLGQIGTVDPSN